MQNGDCPSRQKNRVRVQTRFFVKYGASGFGLLLGVTLSWTARGVSPTGLANGSRQRVSPTGPSRIEIEFEFELRFSLLCPAPPEKSRVRIRTPLLVAMPRSPEKSRVRIRTPFLVAMPRSARAVIGSAHAAPTDGYLSKRERVQLTNCPGAVRSTVGAKRLRQSPWASRRLPRT